MKKLPAIFSRPMVDALLDGRKTMTRRLAWRFRDVGDNHTKIASAWQSVEIGDLIYVRETHWRYGWWMKNGKTKTGAQRWRFKAEGTMISPPVRFDRETIPKPEKTELGFHKRPSIFLPRRFSRMTLHVTAKKVERLQGISEEDAVAEGVGRANFLYPASGVMGSSFEQGFLNLWVKLHGEQSLAENPEVVAVSFKVHHCNVDSVEMKRELAA